MAPVLRSIAAMSSKRLLLAAVAAAIGTAAVVATMRADRPRARTALEDGTQATDASSIAQPTTATLPGPWTVTGAEAAGEAAKTAIAMLGWGSGAGDIGKPAEEEGHGETPLRLATDSAGGVLLLDGANGRVVRLGLDGRRGADLKLPIDDPRDVAVAKDGTVLLLDADPKRANVLLLGPDGKTKASLPLPKDAAASSRSVVVSGDDVYVEAHNGELTRIGSPRGIVDPNPSLAPGRPLRDGSGYVNALIPDPDSGRVHVYVVDRATQAQRWSRLLAPAIAVEGIFLTDTSAAGTIYLGITGDAPGAPPDRTSAMLLCLEPRHGEVIGAVDLPVSIGEEAILDAKALDSGGVVFSVHTKSGVRVERHDCL